MTLMFAQGHRVAGKLELVHCVVKLHEATQMFMMVDYVRQMTVRVTFYCEKLQFFVILYDSV